MYLASCKNVNVEVKCPVQFICFQVQYLDQLLIFTYDKDMQHKINVVCQSRKCYSFYIVVKPKIRVQGLGWWMGM